MHSRGKSGVFLRKFLAVDPGADLFRCAGAEAGHRRPLAQRNDLDRKGNRRPSRFGNLQKAQRKAASLYDEHPSRGSAIHSVERLANMMKNEPRYQGMVDPELRQNPPGLGLRRLRQPSGAFR
jgi:hypothetical protein